jgi:tetrahydromethanopterin S-methyltransferase subunit C
MSKLQKALQFNPLMHILFIIFFAFIAGIFAESKIIGIAISSGIISFVFLIGIICLQQTGFYKANARMVNKND